MPSLRPNKKSFFLLPPAASGILYEDDAAHQQGCPATVMRMVVVMFIAAGTESGDWELIARGLRTTTSPRRTVGCKSQAQPKAVASFREIGGARDSRESASESSKTPAYTGGHSRTEQLCQGRGNSRPHLKQMHHLCVCVCMCVCVRVIYLFAVECITLPNHGLDPNECSNTQANRSEMFLN